MSSMLNFSPERAMQSAKKALEAQLWNVLQAKEGLDVDQSLYGANGLPKPVYIGASPHDDLAIDQLTPGVFLEYRLSNSFLGDASHALRTRPTIEARVLLSEHDTGTTVPEEFVAQIDAYLGAIAYVLSTWWIDRGAACDAGVDSARIVQIDRTPLVRVAESSVWVRMGRVVIELDQRLFNQWDQLIGEP